MKPKPSSGASPLEVHKHQCEECKGFWECYIKYIHCPIAGGKWDHKLCQACVCKPTEKGKT